MKAPCPLTGGEAAALGKSPARHSSSEMPIAGLNALADAWRSINHGGLCEIGCFWEGEFPGCKREHRGSVIDQLCADGLLDRIGRTPMRRATITETGLMVLDLEGRP